ncbi:HEPN domain-containing protein [bacterium]|nr:HEPN domain-containing protein [bacterium]
MHDPKDIVEAYLIESEIDIEAARLTYVNGLYSRTIHFAQEAVEKITKACLTMRSVVTRDHKTSTLFLAVFRGEIDDIDKIYGAIISLEKHGARTRFPLYQRKDLPLWVPSKVYGESEAMEALSKGEYVYKVLKEFVQSNILTSA